MKRSTFAPLMLLGLLAVSSCDKMDVSPSVSAPSTKLEALSKTRGIEAPVTGTVDGVTFTATLHIISFFEQGSRQIFAFAYLDKVKGVKPQVGSTLENKVFSYNAGISGSSCTSLAVNLFTYYSDNLGFNLKLTPVTAIVDSNSPRYDLLGESLCLIEQKLILYNTNERPDSLPEIVALLNEVATTVGRY